MKFVAAFALLTGLRAQALTIACGSPTDQYFSAGSVAWSMPVGIDPSIAFLRYAQSFSYDIPLQSGFYQIAVTMAEPNKTAAGQRVFTVSAQGQTSAPVDLFAITGADNVAYMLPLTILMTFNGTLHLQFTGLGGQNAVVSQIKIDPVIWWA